MIMRPEFRTEWSSRTDNLGYTSVQVLFGQSCLKGLIKFDNRENTKDLKSYLILKECLVGRIEISGCLLGFEKAL